MERRREAGRCHQNTEHRVRAPLQHGRVSTLMWRWESCAILLFFLSLSLLFVGLSVFLCVLDMQYCFFFFFFLSVSLLFVGLSVYVCVGYAILLFPYAFCFCFLVCLSLCVGYAILLFFLSVSLLFVGLSVSVSVCWICSIVFFFFFLIRFASLCWSICLLVCLSVCVGYTILLFSDLFRFSLLACLSLRLSFCVCC